MVLKNKYTHYNFDFDSDEIKNHLEKIDLKGLSEKEIVIKLYKHVRDNWHYSPYKFSLKKSDWKASKIVNYKKGHCLDKAVLLITFLRAHNIPAKLGLAKVKNHIAVDDIVEKFGSEELVPHGYVDVFLNGKWVKATPAFNKELCEMLGVAVLEFDGENDSLFQEFDTTGTKNFMEYLDDYGTFNEVPLEFMLELLLKHYPNIQKKNVKLGDVLDLAQL
ncbi:transglutaminase-like domain-containing protein [Tenacibaculum sp. IB213877]|uniref:transglutaminase-like domain-containing protein n=1 Tax=Tenacibaculum sp. IB213877 TaxID=3097351 RepID=UPI002A5AF5CE|nr:transglutaminase-like domain-containing protein [Tenacibaculum sp. IB213877]MDY0779500.1 transglutaminase-like domain-containing protein [Tenacibaculum sp. IB213877]